MQMVGIHSMAQVENENEIELLEPNRRVPNGRNISKNKVDNENKNKNTDNKLAQPFVKETDGNDDASRGDGCRCIKK